MAEQRICILGGTGFVGSTLTARLARAGHPINVPTRYREAGRHLLVLPTVRLVRADVHDPATLPLLFTGVDTVINLIGILNERRRETFQSVYVDLVDKVLAAAEAAGVRRLLQMSALNADAQSAPSRYLRSRGAAEQRLHAHRGNLGWTVFQPSVIFGRDDSFINRFLGLLDLAPVLPLARADARLAPVYVEDVVDAFVHCLSADETRGRSYQLCGPEALDLKRIIATIGRAAGRERPVIGLPDLLGCLQAAIAEWLPGKPFSIDNFRSLSVDSVCREDGFAALGLRPRSFTAMLPLLIGGHRDARLRRFRKNSP